MLVTNIVNQSHNSFVYRLCVNVVLYWVLVLLAGQQICSGAFGKGEKPTIT